ncbi:MAG: hypothetical protein ACK5B9_11480 [Flavobacteriia bacterium]|jgi:hypothetical protein
MQKTNVKGYSSNQLLARARAIEGFKEIPKGYWLLFVRSNEDEFDKFDDKVYLFQGVNFIMVTSCTTNKGGKGTAVVKSDQWMYDGFINGLHKGKMECLRQNKPFYFYRDFNKDKKADETGALSFQNIQTQFHGSTYNKGVKKILSLIGLWSEGCFVCNVNEDYELIIQMTRKQKIVSGCLLKEF